MPTYSELLQRARDSIRAGQYASAEGFAREAAAMQPDDPEVFGILGIALSRAHRSPEALEAFQKAIAMAPHDAKGYYNLAAHYYSIGAKEEALAEARKALDQDPSHRPSHELIERMQTDSPEAPRMSYPDAPTPPVHSVAWVRNFGAGWNVMGWFIFGALMVSRYVLEFRASSFQAGATGDLTQQGLQTMEFVLDQQLPLVIGILVWFGLLCIWWSIDIADRRPAGGLVTASIIAMLAVCFCALFTLIMFPIYMFTRTRAWGSR